MGSHPAPEDRPCVSAEEALAQLGIDRTTGYRAIRQGRFPLPVIRVGPLIRVRTAALRDLLGTDGRAEPGGYADATGSNSGPARTVDNDGPSAQADGTDGPAAKRPALHQSCGAIGPRRHR